LNARDISLDNVLAQWGYSEVIDSQSESCYANVPNIEAIREKRRTAVPFSRLSEPERDALATACRNCRPSLMHFFNGVIGFQLIPVNREYVGALWIPPHAWEPQAQGRFVRFAQFEAIPPHTESPGDARNVICRPKYEPPADPLAVGWYQNHQPILLDGFHRAVAFWRCAPAGSLLRVYSPA